jgi:hypothetical protein
MSQFPCTYLSLPMHCKNLPKHMAQSLVQKIGNKLLRWKRDLLSYPDREALVKSVLFMMPMHFLTIYKLSAWAKQDIDRYRRSFLWWGDDLNKVWGGHCLVKWKVCTRPRKWGGLGIKDLDKFDRALRLRRLWYNWDSHDRTWKSLLKFCDNTDPALFFASTVITFGNGKNTSFWEFWWINGVSRT